MRDTQSQGADDLRARLEEAERDGAKLQGLNQRLAARVAELEKQQEAGKAPACHHHRITPECPECDKGKAPACECPKQALEILDELTYGHEAMIHQALRAELTAEKERADSDYAGWERVKQKFEDTWNESKRLRARVDTAESTLAASTDLANSWAREVGTQEARDPSSLGNLIDRLWSHLSTREYSLRARVEALEAALATAAGPIEVIGSEIRRSGTAYPQMPLELQAAVLYAQDTLRAALKEGK